jgi:RNA polymerase sigma factor (sigma-70 family)
MSSASVTEWLENLKDGESQAAQKLWERYLHGLLRLARRKLGHRQLHIADEDDIVADVFVDFFRAAEAGQFAKLDDRHDLWQVLVMLTERKVIDQLRRERAAKRNAAQHVSPEAADAAHGHVDQDNISQVSDGEPTPAFAAEAAEHLDILLLALPDDLRVIATQKLEGYTNSEIATRLHTSLRSVERRLGLIRQIWIDRDLL